MKYLLQGLIFFPILGCASFPDKAITFNSVNSYKLRTPAATGICDNELLDKTESIKIKGYSDEKLKKALLFVFGSLETPIDAKNSFRKIAFVGRPSTGQDYFIKYSEGQSTGKIALRLGMKIQDSSMELPDSLFDLYKNIYREISEAAYRHGLSEDDLVLPASLFKRGFNGFDEYKAVRLGIDPLPTLSKGWKFENVGIVDYDQHTLMIADGKLPFNPIRAIAHDIGHPIDYSVNPDYMKKYKQYSIKKIVLMKNRLNPFLLEKINQMESVMNEILYFARPDQVNFIHSMFSITVKDTPPVRKAILEKYNSLSKTELLALAKTVLKNAGFIYNPHGGGARDTEAVDKITQMTVMESDIADRIAGQLPSRPNIDAVLLEDLPGAIERIRKLLELEQDRAKQANILALIGAELKDLNIKMNKENTLAHSLQVLRTTLAELEFQVLYDLKVGLRPDSVLDDVTVLLDQGWLSYSKTKTYLYFKTLAAPGTARWSIWVKSPN